MRKVTRVSRLYVDVQQVRGAHFLSLSFSNAVLYTETRYTHTSGSMHDEGLPVLSPIPYDSLEANHKIVIEMSYAVTLEQHDRLTYHATSERTTCIDVRY